NDEPFSSEGVFGGVDVDVAVVGPTVDIGGSAGAVDLDVTTAPDAGGDFSLPEVPEAGGDAPPLSERPFASAVQAAGWGIDGGWLAPFALLALAIPLLTKARTFAPTRTLRR